MRENLKLRELPGWAEALAEVNRTLRWPLGGDVVQVVGAFAPPPSVSHVTPWLLYNLAVAVDMHRWQERVRIGRAKRAERAGNVISLEEHRLQVTLGVLRKLQGDRAQFPFRPPSERSGGYGADGEYHEPASPPWAPGSHEGGQVEELDGK